MLRCFAFLLLCDCALAQGTSLDELLSRMTANSDAYQSTAPSLSAEERLVSQKLSSGKVKKETRVRLTFRVLRLEGESNRFRESREFLEVDGKAVDGNRKITFPILFSGAFGNAIASFFSAQHRPCYSFELTPGSEATLKISFTAKPVSESACQDVAPGLRGLAVIDKATSQIVHLERSIPAGSAEKMHRTPFASIDYAPVDLGGERYWLPSAVEARDDKAGHRFHAEYSGYKRFQATGDIVPQP